METLPPKNVEEQLMEALKFTAKVAKKIRKDFEDFEKKREKVRKEIESGAKRTKGFII